MKNVPSTPLGDLYREHIRLISDKDIGGLLDQYASDAILISSFEKIPKYFHGHEELKQHSEGILGTDGLDPDIAFWAETQDPTTLMIVEAITLQTAEGAASMRFADS